MNNFPIDLTDRDGEPLAEKDVIFNNEDFYKIYWNHIKGFVEAISCTRGYIHGVTQEMLRDFKRVGPFKGNEHLFECD